MDTATTIHINRVTGATDLHRWYEGETAPQPAYLYLGLRDGELTCTYDANVGGGVTADVFHNRTITVSIPHLTADAANALMEDVQPIAQRILNGADIEWDGSNHVGTLDDDAQAAYDELVEAVESWAEDAPTVETVSAYDWFSEGDDADEEYGLSADTTDVELAEIERTAQNAIESGSTGTVVVENLAEYLTEMRDKMRSAVRDELEEVAATLDELAERRDSLIRRVKRFGDSDRAVAALAGLSHTGVQKIAKAGASDVGA